jgi:hypothetical protein
VALDGLDVVEDMLEAPARMPLGFALFGLLSRA